jgi:FixJ family two-component response regulator
MLEREEFALVITDLKMPGMSGTELLTAIRGKNPNLPVIVISGYNVASADEVLVDGLASGFIQKPFKMTDIQSVIEKHLR